MDAREYHERTKLALSEDLPDSLVPTPDPETKPRLWKQYVDRPQVELPSIRPPTTPALSAVARRNPDPLGGAETGAPPTDRETLATLCYEAGGVTQATERDGETVTFRAASCTGRMYHVNLYLVAGPLADLEAGVYHFDPTEFALDRLREGEYRGALAAAVGPPDADETTTAVASAPATAVLTSTWWRNAWRYGDRAYRHVFWDAGTVAANLLAAAHALDRRASVVASFADEAVADLLGVDTERELPVAVVPLGRGESAERRAVAPVDPETVPPGPVTREHAPIREAWRQSRLADGQRAAEWRRRCRETGAVGTAEPGAGERVELDPVDARTASARPLHATVRRRTSCREFATRGPSRRQVGTVLDRATRGVPGDWHSADGRDGPGLAYNDLHVLATGVDGLRDGHYRYHPPDGLERLGETTVGDTRRLALGQDWAGEAQVNVYMLADVDGVVERLGDRGYRLAQLEAGVTLGRLYLATYAHRALGGTGLTFADDQVTAHCDPGGRTPTCLFAFGRRGD